MEGLNGTVVTDLAQYGNITHIIADKLLRRSKFMAALAAGANFVNPMWLEQSKKSGVFLPCDDFAIADDPKDEEKYGTTLRNSLENAKLAREHGGVLANKAVFVCHGVVGKKGGPTLAETKLLIKFAGGSFAKSQAQALSLLGPSKLLIIAEKGVALPNKLSNAEAKGATRINLQDFFDILLHQSLDPIGKVAKVNEEAKNDSEGEIFAVPVSDHVVACVYMNSRKRFHCVYSGSKKNSENMIGRLHLELPSQKEVRLAKEKADKRAEEVAVLIEQKKVQMDGLEDDHQVSMAKMNEHHEKEMIKTNECQAMEMKSMVSRHASDLKATAVIQDKERKNLIENHAQVQGLHAAELKSLKQELLQLKTKQVSSATKMYNCSMVPLHEAHLLEAKLPKTRPNLSNKLQARFDITLNRDKSYGRANILEVGEVEAEVWTEGQYPNKSFVRMTCCSDGKANAIFLAYIPEVDIAHEKMFGNAGGQDIVVWQADNELHSQMGTTIKGAKDKWNATGSRRYYLHFKDRSDIDSFLELVNISREEWYDTQGKFFQEKYIMPANRVELSEDDMDTEHEALNQTMTMEEMEEEFGHDIYACSQPF